MLTRTISSIGWVLTGLDTEFLVPGQQGLPLTGPGLLRLPLHQHLVLLVDEALELALLEVADQYLLLLRVIHLAELPQLILLEDAERPKIRCPLSPKILHLFVELCLSSQVTLHLIEPPICISLASLSNRHKSAHTSACTCTRATHRYACGP